MPNDDLLPVMNAQADRAFADIERRNERTLAVLRLFALLILALVYGLGGFADRSQATMVPLIGFTLITVVGFVTARRHLFRPWVPWLLATLDVGFLMHCLTMDALVTGQALALTLEFPAALLIFVFLATAAIRQRPLLILYTGGLFIFGWSALWLFMPSVSGVPSGAASLTGVLARLAVVGLATFALFVAVHRARRALMVAIVETGRRTNLSRYFSPKLVEELAHRGDEARAFQTQKAAVLFADLRGFTGLAEAMPADEVGAFLNEYRRRIAEPIGRHDGSIDKFIGDGVMAVFGVPEPQASDARNAVRAGLELVSAIDGWCAERRAAGLPPVAIGIGIHYGEVIAGALGDDHRLEYTVVGDAVNTASRIERLAADLATPLLVSSDVLAAAPGLEKELRLTSLPDRFLRGRRQPISLYGIAGRTVGLARSRATER